VNKGCALFIDDVRNIPRQVQDLYIWDVARTAHEARSYISNCNYDLISFDNDLGSRDRKQEGQAILALLLLQTWNKVPIFLQRSGFTQVTL
jgi:hypothetical protein